MGKAQSREKSKDEVMEKSEEREESEQKSGEQGDNKGEQGKDHELEEAPLIVLTILPLSGESFDVSVPSSGRVSDIKKQISGHLGLDPRMQQLFAADQEQDEKVPHLSDYKTIESYGLANGETLHLIQLNGPAKYNLSGHLIGGAHTNNPSYFKYHGEKCLELKSVCWLSVAGHIPSVLPSEYEVVILYKATDSFRRTKLDIAVKQENVADALLKMDFNAQTISSNVDPNNDEEGYWDEQVLGRIDVSGDAESRISICFDNRSGSWKSGMFWKAVELRRIFS